VSSHRRQLHLGAFLYGTGAFLAGWRLPGAFDDNENIRNLCEIVATAERGKFDMVFFADGVGFNPSGHPSEMAKLEPTTLLAALAMCSKHIGLGGTVSTSFSDPYNVARMFSSVDHISGGRAAWNVVTSSSQSAAKNFGKRLPLHEERYKIADEFVSVVKKLWDSWQDDSFVRNRETGVFLDPSKIRPINHEGKYFSVAGALNCSRPPQGHPVIIQAGSSDAGMDLAAKYAEVVFTVQQDVDEAREFYNDLKRRVIAAGRDPDHCKVLPGLFPVVARTRAEAHAKLQQFISFIDEKIAIGTISVRFGHDMSKYPLDGPLPELPKSELSQSFSRVMFSRAKRENMTWRQIYSLLAVGRGYIIPCGTPDDVAAVMEEWFVQKACDGFIVTPSDFPRGFNDFVNLVIPTLQKRGLFRKDYVGKTLREHLGLPRPAGRTSV
jgi:FMN-dependent oxidoreductase (nitrilotriacetate monooxygenase family)